MRKSIVMDETIGHNHPEYGGVAYGMLAWDAFDRGDYDEARSYFDRDLTQACASGSQWRLAMTLMHTASSKGGWGISPSPNSGSTSRCGCTATWAMRGNCQNLADRATLHVERSNSSKQEAAARGVRSAVAWVNLPDRLAHFRQLCGLLALRRNDCEMAARQPRRLCVRIALGHQKYMDEDLLLVAELALAVQLPLPALCLLAAHGAYTSSSGLTDYPRLKQQVDSMIGAAGHARMLPQPMLRGCAHCHRMLRSIARCRQ